MRIAHFIQRYPPALGGSEAYFRRLSQFHVAAGDEVDVWTTVARDVSAFWSPTAQCFAPGIENDAGVSVRRYPLWRMRGRRWLLKPLSLIPLRAWQALTLPCNPISVRMWRDTKATPMRYDAVHATAFPYAWSIACAHRLARRQGIPFLLTPFLHLNDAATRRAYTQPALRRLLRAADRVFAQTRQERDAILKLGVREDRVVLQGLGVDVAECTGGDRRAARAQWQIGEHEIVIGHLANLSAEKGTIDLLRAAAKCSPCVVVLAGPAMPNFEKFIGQFGERIRVLRLGLLSEEQKRDFYAGIDIFALPSRSDSFGLVLLEAWANGIPNVVYRSGGPGEIVHHGEDGLLAGCGNIAELTNGLNRLIASTNLRRQYGAAGRDRLANEFDWESKLELVRSTIHASRVGTGIPVPTSVKH